MAESRTNGGGSRGTFAVHPAADVSPEVSTHESNPGDGEGGSGGGGEDGLKKGDTLGRYLVLGQLGAGAMGVVYAAYDPELDRKIAIKILRPQEGKGDKTRRQERLVREAKAMAKLSHPNVGAIYDVGVHGDQVFLAMEFLSGGTLRDWMAAKKRPWRDVVKMFIEVGKGLAGAHAEGLIHRDFKPDNVLLDKNGVPKVVDFGLVRLTGAALDRSTTGSMDAITEDEAVALPLAQTALAAHLTRTGALTGTPAYMAPEQFLGKPIDARTDQFAFCIALYEALYGERPFAGDTLIAIADTVTAERIKTIPKSSDIPNWIRRCLVRGLRADPGQRYPEIDGLLAALAKDPVVQLRRRVGGVAIAVAVIAVIVTLQRRSERRRQQLEKQVASLVADSDANLAEGKKRTLDVERGRHQAFASYDEKSFARGEELWQQVLKDVQLADSSFRKAGQSAEAAFRLDPSGGIKDRIAEILRLRILAAERDGRAEEKAALVNQLKLVAPEHGFLGELARPAQIDLSVEPPAAEVVVERYDEKPDGRRDLVRVDAKMFLGGTVELAAGTHRYELAAGTYRFRLTAPGFAEVQFPVLMTRADRKSVTINLLPASRVPPGFVHIPAGTFLFGDPDEALRQSFLKTVPQHESTTGAFLIARTEVTFGEWIEFLSSLPDRERARMIPRSVDAQITSGRAGTRGGVELLPANDGSWRLRVAPATREYLAATGQPIRYAGRSKRASQRWDRLPVTGVSVRDAKAYFAWLDRSGRVRNARLCTEREWERAARGADDRLYPHGNLLAPDDANQDVTYGRIPDAYGPDEVGSYPRSRSPFGVDDLAGNVWEFLASSLVPEEIVVRGGGFYHQKNDARVTNRQPMDPSARGLQFGLRTCADIR